MYTLFNQVCNLDRFEVENFFCKRSNKLEPTPSPKRDPETKWHIVTLLLNMPRLLREGIQVKKPKLHDFSTFYSFNVCFG